MKTGDRMLWVNDQGIWEVELLIQNDKGEWCMLFCDCGLKAAGFYPESMFFRNEDEYAKWLLTH